MKDFAKYCWLGKQQKFILVSSILIHIYSITVWHIYLRFYPTSNLERKKDNLWIFVISNFDRISIEQYRRSLCKTLNGWILYIQLTKTRKSKKLWTAWTFLTFKLKKKWLTNSFFSDYVKEPQQTFPKSFERLNASRREIRNGQDVPIFCFHFVFLQRIPKVSDNLWLLIIALRIKKADCTLTLNYTNYNFFTKPLFYRFFRFR